MHDDSGLDLLASTAELIAVPSESLLEDRLADLVESELRALAHLEVERVGHNVVARTTLGRPSRLMLAGHLDTVPANGNAQPRLEGDVLYGLGATDMKGGLAVMLALARTMSQPAMDVTWVFYAAEEISAVHNGLAQLFRERPLLMEADAAILGEPTSAVIEAGCQGTLRVKITLLGARAHTARAWMGRNAIHRAGELLHRLVAYEPRRPVLDGCEFHEAVQAVGIEGGVAGNVVPDEVTVTVNVRFAPDRSARQAEHHLQELLKGVVEPDDRWEVVDSSDSAAPGLDHPLLNALRVRSGRPVRAKLGWTDVARFSAHGVPALNFGPGDPRLAHTAGEYVEAADLSATYDALKQLLTEGV